MRTYRPREVALFHALGSTWTVHLLAVSPRLCGSNPYPCGSLTYRSGPRGRRANLFIVLYAFVHDLSMVRFEKMKDVGRSQGKEGVTLQIFFYLF